jgi:hypothetical protein
MEDKKKEVKQCVSTQLVWNKLHEIETVQKEIDRLKGLGVTYIEFDIDEEFGVPCLDVATYYLREETDEEYDKRVNSASIAQKRMLERELELYKRLKIKYENQ